MSFPLRCWFAGAVLAALLLVLGSPLAPIARAQTADGALVELLPPGVVVADGRTPVGLAIVALGPDGAPLAGFKARASASAGDLGKLRELAPGSYTLEFTPPLGAGAGEAVIELTGRTRDKTVIARRWSVPLVSPLAERVTLQANPPIVTLGAGATATLSFELQPAGAADLSVDDLVVEALSGSVANLTALGGGRVTALYTAPSVNYPHLELITVADRRDPGRVHGHLVLPLVGRTSFPVTTTPGSGVLLAIGAREFGPVVADAAGRAQVPVEVPPGVNSATLTTPSGTTVIDLGIPPTVRAVFLPLPAGVPGDPGLTLPVRAFVVGTDGRPDAGTRPRIVASAGRIGDPVYEGDGVYRADFNPPEATGPGSVTFGMDLPGEPESLARKATVALVPPAPGAVGLDVPEGSLATGRRQEATIRVTASDGRPLGGRGVQVFAAGGQVVGTAREREPGVHTAEVVPGGGALELWATSPVLPTGGPVRSLVLLPSTDRVFAEGWSSVLLTVLALDGFGQPVPSVNVALALVAGDGTLPSSVVTGPTGVARVAYTAGPRAGLASIQASVGTVGTAVSLLQGPAAVIRGVPLGRSGTAASVAREAAWRARIPVLRHDPGLATVSAPAPSPPAAPAPVAVAPAPVAVAPAPVAVATPAAVAPSPAEPPRPVATLELACEAGGYAPGERLVLTARLLDDRGAGVSGQRLEVLSSAGSLAATQDLGGGAYRLEIAVPRAQREDLKVTVSTVDGEKTRFLRVAQATARAPVAEAPAPEAAAPAAGSPPSAPAPVSGSPAPAPPAALPPPREPRAPPVRTRAARWLRARATLGADAYGFAYSQEGKVRGLDVEGEPTPFKRSLTLVGEDRALVPGGAASPMLVPTLDVQARGWIPPLPYLGVDLRYRAMVFAVDTDSFTQPSEGKELSWFDSFFTASVQGRYFHDFGDQRLWAGLHVGTVTTALPLPAMWARDGGEPTLWFFPWGFTSFWGGARAGAEFGFGLDLLVDFGFGTEAYTGLFATGQGVELSFDVADHVSLSLHYDRLVRRAVIPGSNDPDAGVEMAVVDDARQGAGLGVGVVY